MEAWKLVSQEISVWSPLAMLVYISHITSSTYNNYGLITSLNSNYMTLCMMPGNGILTVRNLMAIFQA